MDREQWSRVVEAATRAPSIHNTQPWSFTATGDRLDVRTDPARGLHTLDRSGRQRIVSGGVAVEFALVALRAAGSEVTVELLPDPADGELLATLTVTGSREASAEDRELGEAIATRHTERAPFRPQAVPAALVDALQHAAATYSVWLKPITEEDEEVTTAFLVSRAEEIEQGEPEYVAELQQWMRTDPSAADGIPVDAVPEQDPATRPSNWLIRDFVVGSRPPRTSPFSDPDDPSAPPPAVERPAVVLMGTDNDDALAWLTAGRALGQVLLRATVAGLAASPLTQALDWPVTRTQLRSRLQLIGHPQMLLRLGYPTGDRTPSTHRRPVDEVLTVTG